jgi:hypothetical protein
VDRNPRVLVRVISALGRYHVHLALQWPPHIYKAILENYRGVAENEVHGAVDVTLSVELALGVDHQGVLVALEGTPVEDGEIRGGAEGDRLTLLRPGRVAKCNVTSHEVKPINPYI